MEISVCTMVWAFCMAAIYYATRSIVLSISYHEILSCIDISGSSGSLYNSCICCFVVFLFLMALWAPFHWRSHEPERI